MSISRPRLSGILPAGRSAQEEFETFIDRLPPLRGALLCVHLHCRPKQKTHRRIVHRGGLPALRSINSLSRDSPTRRRTVAATTDAGAEADPTIHGTASIIQRRKRKSIRGK